jgi:heme A synthase
VSRRAFRRLADLTLAATLVTILWGAFVRATGSGAGCGSHWPTCNGEVVPRAPTVATLVEYTHRLTSGVVGLLALGLFVAALIALPRGHLGRPAAAVSLLLMIVEAAVGAGLVLFEKVAGDASLARGVWMSAHLVNTLLLLAALGMVCWAARHERSPRLVACGRAMALLVPALLALLAVGVTGAIAALGDTLFPARTLAEGVAQDFHPSAHPFVQLRVLHPLLAAAAALHLVIVGATFARSRDRATKRYATWVGLGAALQVAVGIINLVLAAPAAMQLVHLLVADLLWLSLVWLTASAASQAEQGRPAQAHSRQSSAAHAAMSTATTKI